MKAHKKYFFIIFFVGFCSISSYSQLIFYQDNCNCGVTGAGFSNGVGTGGIGQIDIQIEPGSTIKKAYLICNRFGNTPPVAINFNGINYIFDLFNQIGLDYFTFNNGIITEISAVHAIDVTDEINTSQSTYSINILTQAHTIGGVGKYGACYLFVVYENITLSQTAISIIINEKDAESNVNYQINNLLPINTLNPVGLAIHSDIIWDTITDGSHISVNGNSIGLIGGSDAVNTMSTGGGVKGHFYYQNSQLWGLDDDTPDNMMLGTDGLADINGYLNNNDNFFDIDLIKQPTAPYNIYISFFLAYTSSCDTFSVFTPNDTTLCLGSTLQLNATGGQSYEWVPSTGLSCSTCPNPIFSADSSMFYTVRIWNNDSCSVVRPLKINVRPQPTFGAITTTPSECGANTGIVTLSALPNNGIVASWQEIGSLAQTSNVFQNLSAGNHTFFFVDTNGCQSADTTVFVGSINSTVANFSVSPQSGAVPLTVTIANTSQNATNYEWFLENVSQGSSFTTSTFGVSGNYEIMLVAWQNNQSCADTAYQTVIVFDSLVVTLPNVFTPNFDGVNDFFTLSANQNVTYELVILNRWGNEVFAENSNLMAGVLKNVWGGNALNEVTDGVYFVKLRLVTEVGEIVEVEDFVTVVR